MDDTKTVTENDFLPLNDPTYCRIVQFLYLEARALDHRDFPSWQAMLAEDIRYRMPIRVTKTKQYDGIDYGMAHFDDDYTSLAGRLNRLKMKSAWAEDPPSRTRRMVSNVLVRRTDNDTEFDVVSYLHLLRSRGDEAEMSHLSCERQDVLRFEADKIRICRRDIIMDQSVLGMPNLAVFL